MAIDFNLIPVSLLVPGVFVEIDESKASSGLAVQKYRALILAQKTTAGSAAADVPVALPNVEEANALFGEGSMAARMAQKFRGRNLFTELDVIPLDDLVAAGGEQGVEVGESHLDRNLVEGRDDPDAHVVACADGVGTKLKLAFALNRHDTVGQIFWVYAVVVARASRLKRIWPWTDLETNIATFHGSCSSVVARRLQRSCQLRSIDHLSPGEDADRKQVGKRCWGPVVGNRGISIYRVINDEWIGGGLISCDGEPGEGQIPAHLELLVG